MIWPYILSGIGLIIEMIGVWGIYKIKIIPLKEPRFYGMHPSSNFQGDSVYGLRQGIEDSIKRQTEDNKINDGKAQKYFYCVLIGFVFQLSSTILGVLLN